ncbi:MAG: ATP-grasp domain-containing protein [Balneolaceae bacterium]|nr:ATP-grasp domain-containing protein [Balneolaceae bacterium]
MAKQRYTIPALACSEIGLVHSLGEAGIPVYSGSFFKDNPALYSRFTKNRYFFSRYDKEEYIDQLVELGKSLDQRPVLYSDDDRAILLISRHREKLKPYYRFLLPDKEIVEKILDKRLFCHLCNDHELPAPVSYEVSSVEEMELVIADLPFPAIVKPAYKQDWWHPDFEKIVGPYKKAYTCNNPDELRELYNKIARIDSRAVVQEYIPGEDDQLYSVNLYVDEGGSLQGYFIAQKRRIYPITAGTGCYVVTVDDKEMKETALEVIKKLNLRGLLNIQFKKDIRNGRPRLMEIHARNSFWSFLGTAAGMNLTAKYYFDLTGQQPGREMEYKPGVKFFDLGKDIKAYWQYKKEDKLTFKDWFKTYSGDFVVGGHLLKDPKPIVMNAWFLLQRRLNMDGQSNGQMPH